ncbi:hypothetical protein ACFC00_02760 [Streptomyces adustus]|uniref:hypothetical protein n=1 Tax=Streptomyces adustus TaxID=1609272 RepID=UPI0035DD7F72
MVRELIAPKACDFDDVAARWKSVCNASRCSSTTGSAPGEDPGEVGGACVAVQGDGVVGPALWVSECGCEGEVASVLRATLLGVALPGVPGCPVGVEAAAVFG